MAADSLPLFFREGDAFIFKKEVVAAHEDLLPMHVFHLRVLFLMVQAFLQRLAHDGPRHAVGEVLFQAGGRFQDVFPAAVAQGDNLRHLGAGGGQRARLVKNDGVRPGEQLHEFSALDHDLARGSFLHGGDDGNGRGELDGAGIIHHQHGERLGDVPGEQEQRTRREQGEGNDGIREFFRPALDAGLQFLRMVNQGDDVVDAGLVAHGVHPDDEGACFQRGPGEDDGAFLLGCRFRFSRHGGLVHFRLPGQDGAVHGDDVAGVHSDLVPGPDLFHGNLAHAVLFHPPDLVHVDAQAGRKRRPGLLPRVIFQQV